MQAARNHIQVGARYDRSPPALVPDYTILHRAALMPDLMSPPSGLYRRVMLLITIFSGRPTRAHTIFQFFMNIVLKVRCSRKLVCASSLQRNLYQVHLKLI